MPLPDRRIDGADEGIVLIGTAAGTETRRLGTVAHADCQAAIRGGAVSDHELVQRVVVLGRGGAGKSIAARALGELLDVPVVELDKIFWSAELMPIAKGLWAAQQAELASAERWIMDGDLGPYDVLAPRLARADTVIILDFGLLRCVWRAVRRSRERRDFWCWMLTWRVRSKPTVLAAVAANSPQSALFVLRRPSQLRRLLQRVAS